MLSRMLGTCDLIEIFFKILSCIFLVLLVIGLHGVRLPSSEDYISAFE
jgi:hypothetical protein